MSNIKLNNCFEYLTNSLKLNLLNDKLFQIFFVKGGNNNNYKNLTIINENNFVFDISFTMHQSDLALDHCPSIKHTILFLKNII